MSENNTPNPGSKAALDLGCTCPVLDNGRGRGWMGIPDVFVYTVGCPVHNEKQMQEQERSSLFQNQEQSE